MTGDRQVVARARVVQGDAAEMGEVPTDAAQLVLTSPPYFDENQDGELRRPVDEQRDFTAVSGRVLQFAESLAPAYREMARVTEPGGAVVVQVKDLRYARALIPLAARHVELASRAGLRLVGRVYWQKTAPRVARSRGFRRSPAVGGFKVDDCEELQVFAHPGGPRRRRSRVAMTEEEIAASSSPLWRLPANGARATHPHESPSGPFRRMIALFTDPGDLVVDPFAGHGTTLRLATDMSRWAIGYEIDADRAGFAARALACARSAAAPPRRTEELR